MTKRKERESAREALRSRTDIVDSTNAATERVPPSPAATEQTPSRLDQARREAPGGRADLIDLPPLAADTERPSPAAAEKTASLLEQATGMLSWEEVKDLIRMSRGIGTPGREMQDLATRIVGHTQIQTVDDNELLETFGTKDRYFARGLIGQLRKMGSIAGDTRTSGDGFDFAISVLRGAKPRDQIAAMLATQMAATHMAIIEYLNRLARSASTVEYDISDRTLGKMLRTFVTQVEAFERYQNGAQQKASVQNVSVNGFGQAIVANVSQDALARSGVSQGAVERAPETPALTHSKERPIKQSGDLARDLQEKYELIERGTGKKDRS